MHCRKAEKFFCSYQEEKNQNGHLLYKMLYFCLNPPSLPSGSKRLKERQTADNLFVLMLIRQFAFHQG